MSKLTKHVDVIAQGNEIDGVSPFEYDGVSISNPFFDESMRWQVNPVEHYGEAFMDAHTNAQLRLLIKRQLICEQDVIHFYNNIQWDDEHE